MIKLRDKLRLAIYNGLQEGEQAIELADRVLAVLDSDQVAYIRDPERPTDAPIVRPFALSAEDARAWAKLRDAPEGTFVEVRNWPYDGELTRLRLVGEGNLRVSETTERAAAQLADD